MILLLVASIAIWGALILLGLWLFQFCKEEVPR
jgi:hypothetical protein